MVEDPAAADRKALHLFFDNCLAKASSLRTRADKLKKRADELNEQARKLEQEELARKREREENATWNARPGNNDQWATFDLREFGVEKNQRQNLYDAAVALISLRDGSFIQLRSFIQPRGGGRRNDRRRNKDAERAHYQVACTPDRVLVEASGFYHQGYTLIAAMHHFLSPSGASPAQVKMLEEYCWRPWTIT